MANTEIYIVRKRRKRWELYKEIPGALRGAFAFWMHIEKKYLPPYREHEKFPPMSRFACLTDSTKMQEVWDLCKDPRLTSAERLVLFSAFDYHYLPFEHIPDMAEAMRWVHEDMGGKSNFGDQADALVRLYNTREDVKAVGFNATSVTSYTDVLTEKFDKEELVNAWEEFVEAEREAKGTDRITPSCVSCIHFVFEKGEMICTAKNWVNPYATEFCYGVFEKKEESK